MTCVYEADFLIKMQKGKNCRCKQIFMHLPHRIYSSFSLGGRIYIGHSKLAKESDRMKWDVVFAHELV
jgi:hypothetical protein